MAPHLPTKISGGENAIATSTGNGYDDGDMVWGKIEPDPWWPGQILNKMFISHPDKEMKHEGDVLVAFFGDDTYGWCDPAKLLPFEEHFDEKPREGFSHFDEKLREASSERYFKLIQKKQEKFSAAVEEAVNELMRRRSFGIECRCRNKYNFSDSGIDGYLSVDVGNDEYVPYSTSQIRKARDSFQPTDMLSFIRQLSLTPMPTNDQYMNIQFMKNEATVLAWRKASFEEFDATWVEAFEVVPKRPSPPTKPLPFNPSTVASLSGRWVVRKAFGKHRMMGLRKHCMRLNPPMDTEASSRSAEAGTKKVKAHKRSTRELRSEGVALAEKKKMLNEEIGSTSTDLVQSSVTANSSAITEHIAGMESNESSKIPANSPASCRASKKLARMPGRASCLLDDQAKEERRRGPFDGVAKIKKKMKVDDKESKIEKQHLNSGESVERKKMNEQGDRKLKRKSIDSRYTKMRIDDSKVLAGQNQIVQPNLPKPSLQEARKVECMSEVLNPTMLIMSFPQNACLPSVMQLNATFVFYGKLNPSDTQVLGRSYDQCHVVFYHKEDAEAALKHCNENKVSFINSNVKCYIREAATKAPKVSEPVLRIGGEPQKHQVKPKSYQKKPAGDRSWKGNGRGRSHFRFASGEGESSRSGGSSSTFAVDGTRRKMLPSFGQPNIASSCPMQFRSNPPARVQNPIDISKQMLDLLKKCSDVVEKVKEDFGYMPYHPL